jgi:hypothetical protein
MAGQIIYSGGPSNNISSGNISYSRKGVYDYVFTYGNRIKIETSFFDTVVSGSFDNPLLSENWDTSVAWNPVTAKTEGAKYQDHFRRYSTAGTDPNMAEADVLKTVSSSASSPRGYREFEETLVKLSTDPVELSPYAFVETDDDIWVRASTKGLSAEVDNDGNIPSILFNADIDAKDLTKDMGKSVTISFWSLGRLFIDGYVTGSNIDTDFHPFLVVTKERFRSEYARKSYRNNPTVASISTAGDTDLSEITGYAENQQDSFRRLMVGGGAGLIGYANDYKNGEIIDTVKVYYEGAYVDKSVGLLITSRRYNFETDTANIGFSRA